MPKAEAEFGDFPGKDALSLGMEISTLEGGEEKINKMAGRLSFVLLLLAALLSACAVNPVTGERELSLVSETQEVQMGEENYLAMRHMQGGDYVVDPELTAYVSQVGQRLAAVSDRPLPYEFTVINDSIPNAWALPGGKIALNRGLLTELNNEAELVLKRVIWTPKDWYVHTGNSFKEFSLRAKWRALKRGWDPSRIHVFLNSFKWGSSRRNLMIN